MRNGKFVLYDGWGSNPLMETTACFLGCSPINSGVDNSLISYNVSFIADKNVKLKVK